MIDFSVQLPGGNQLNVSKLQEPIELFVSLNAEKPQERNNTGDKYFVKPGEGDENMRYHVVNVPAKATVAVSIKPQGNKLLEVYASYGIRPTSEKHKLSAILPDFSSCVKPFHNFSSYKCDSDPFLFSISARLTGNSGRHYIGIKTKKASKMSVDENINPDDVISSDDVPARDDTQSRAKRDCGSLNGRQKRSCIGVKDPPTTPPPTPKIIIPQYDINTDVNYTLSVTVSSCMYWSETKQEWTDEGCKVNMLKYVLMISNCKAMKTAVGKPRWM